MGLAPMYAVFKTLPNSSGTWPSNGGIAALSNSAEKRPEPPGLRTLTTYILNLSELTLVGVHL